VRGCPGEGIRGGLSAYDTVATSLALLGDAELRELVDRATPRRFRFRAQSRGVVARAARFCSRRTASRTLGTGIGGSSARLHVSGTPVR
jgi:hypothetical protein